MNPEWFGMRPNGNTSDLWPIMVQLEETQDNLVTSTISDKSEIYPVFRKLFEKQRV